MYLNLCDWLDPQAKAINERLKDCGGLKFIDPKTGAEVVIEKFDLVHSFLGEMRPGSIRDHTNGGHLFIAELKAAKLDVGSIKSFGNGFFDMEIKYAGKVSDKFKPNSYFPVGTSVDQAVNMIEDAIKQAAKNPKKIKKFELSRLNNITKIELEIESQINQNFKLYIKNGEAGFFPSSPFDNKFL